MFTIQIGVLHQRPLNPILINGLWGSLSPPQIYMLNVTCMFIFLGTRHDSPHELWWCCNPSWFCKQPRVLALRHSQGWARTSSGLHIAGQMFQLLWLVNFWVNEATCLPKSSSRITRTAVLVKWLDRMERPQNPDFSPTALISFGNEFTMLCFFFFHF